ncbi:MAG: DUF3021 domain-containing protein [Lachnospiraceae bacterium]|nr:DUF3021 domain-containing protein [Lachnospiraceae bacterium]
MREVIKRGAISFAISSFVGTLVNLIIDIMVNAFGITGFISMSKAYVEVFQTPVIAAYINVLLYGVIGFTFAAMTIIYDVDRIGFVLQSIIYYVVTLLVCLVITVFVWQLHRYPQAFIITLIGYTLTHVIIFVTEYRELKRNISAINENCEA